VDKKLLYIFAQGVDTKAHEQSNAKVI